MKKELAAFIVLLAAVAFGSGFWTGRAVPAHHYEHLFPNSETASNAVYLFDTTTGKVCSAWKPFEEEANNFAFSHSNDPISQALTESKQQDAVSAKGRDPMIYIPPCGQ